MGSDLQHNQAEPTAINEAQAFWGHFTKATKYSVIAIVVLLALMALFLV